jgi:hypothetical protein
MVTFTADDDRRQSYAANQSRRAVNAARQRKATVGNVDWAMSRPAEWYKNRENLASIKDTLVNQKGNRDFWTTDQDESRNAYQMLMNQMRGGGGARMMDLRGLPAATQADPNRYRRGRRMFQDPSRSQGFLGDVGSLLSGKNKAAVYADEYNPFPKSGFGKDWYRDQFPIASGLGSLMEAAEKFVPGIGTLGRMFSKERTPLERDLSWVPKGMGEYDELPMMEFEDEVDEVSDLDLFEPYLENAQIDTTHLYPYRGRGELSEDFDYSQFPSGVDEDITENLEEIITEDDGEEVITNVDEIFENEDVFNRVFEFVEDRGDGPDLPTAWEHMHKMRDLLGWDEEKMLEHLINNGVLRERP